ncbi:flagellar P-ring protein [Salmonella enterica]|nr:flagellar P-ring protein [Salmonella enterica]
MFKALAGIVLALVATLAHAERIRDLTSVQGVRENSLIGYGLVVGLDGTGDQTTQTPFTTQTLNNMLSQLGITVPTGTNMQLKNVAAVMVTASYPPFARQGQTIDVVVSSMGNAKSLRGGTLLMTPLKGVDSQVYALAQGNILVGGAGASAGGSSVQVNQLNGGRITNGAIIERELPTQFGAGNTINLQLNDEDFTMAQQITDAINRARGYGSATALDARTVQVRVPSGNSSQVRFLADIQNMEVNVTPQDAKVVINSRTGSVVMNREVTLDSCAVAQGNLSVTVNRQLNVNQPNTPFGGGQTVVTPQTQIDLRQSGGSLQSVRSSANLNSVVRALNALGATPMDLMSILQSMQSAGCLRDELKAKAGQDPAANIRPVARQVEGMFVQMMLKSMREALPKDGLFSSDQTRLYTSMYDQQIAQQMTAGKGLGLADMMVKQMTSGQTMPADDAPQVPLKFSLETVNSYQNQALTQLVRKAIPKTPDSSDAPLSGDSKDFLARLSLPARLASEQSGVPHHLILAQAALESGWGQRQILRENGEPSYNVFGVKATASWKGPVTEITTTEYENGEAKKVKAKFRVYSSYLEALSDYVALLTRNPRYAAVTTAATAEQGAVALQNAGYATDPNYARKLTSMIQQLKAMSEKVSKTYSANLDNLF